MWCLPIWSAALLWPACRTSPVCDLHMWPSEAASVGCNAAAASAAAAAALSAHE